VAFDWRKEKKDYRRKCDSSGDATMFKKLNVIMGKKFNMMPKNMEDGSGDV
jgi:hypothetical protein